MEPEEKCFSIIWKVENLPLCSEKLSEPIKSPTFVVDSMDGTEWQLNLYPRGADDYTPARSDLTSQSEDSNMNSPSTSDESKASDSDSPLAFVQSEDSNQILESTSVQSENIRSDYISIYLLRKSYVCVPIILKVKYELAFIGKDGSVLVSAVLTDKFNPRDDFGSVFFVKQSEVFDTKRSIFLPEDTLTVRCRMWKTDEAMLQEVQCFARTRIAVEKGSFLWTTENFSALEAEKRGSYLINSPKNASPLLSVDLFLTAVENSGQIICFVPIRKCKSIKYATLKLYLVSASGNKVECNQEEFWFRGNKECKTSTFLFTREMLLASKKLYLPNDVLSIYVEWAVSKGVELRIIEDIPDAHKIDKRLPQNFLFDTVKSFYDEKFLCDVELKTLTGTFSAHKVILSAYSPVFKSLLKNMQQEGSDCIHVDDLSDEIVKSILHYIYTSSVEDLTWEKATELFSASYSYALPSLKNICSSYMTENLSTSNACKLLLLADKHGDEVTKKIVLDFIEKHEKEFAKSDWRFLMNSNTMLSAEVLHRLINEN